MLVQFENKYYVAEDIVPKAIDGPALRIPSI